MAHFANLPSLFKLPPVPPFAPCVVIVLKLLPGDGEHLEHHHQAPHRGPTPGHGPALFSRAGLVIVLRPHGRDVAGQTGSHRQRILYFTDLICTSTSKLNPRPRDEMRGCSSAVSFSSLLSVTLANWFAKRKGHSRASTTLKSTLGAVLESNLQGLQFS